MEEYLAATELGDSGQEQAVFVRDRMVPAKPFAPIEARSFLARVLQRVTVWHAKRQSRLRLYDLSADQLADIGISRVEADQESRKALLSSWTRSL